MDIPRNHLLADTAKENSHFKRDTHAMEVTTQPECTACLLIIIMLILTNLKEHPSNFEVGFTVRSYQYLST